MVERRISPGVSDSAGIGRSMALAEVDLMSRVPLRLTCQE
jgi:hypothetical protein